MDDKNKTDEQKSNEESLNIADSSIVSNLSIQGIIWIVLMFLYLIFRTRIKWLYVPNVKNKPSHPCYNYNGMLNWLIPLFTIKDTALLNMIGLDAFMMLQAIKLIYRIIFIVGFISLPVLGYFIYYKTGLNGSSSRDRQILFRFSIGNLDKDNNLYFLIPILIYAISFVVLYLLFIYYKRYVVLRQLYLTNPATMTSVVTLKKYAVELGSAEEVMNYLNISTRTVLVTKVPQFIKNDQEFASLINGLKIGDVEECTLIQDTTELQKYYLQRDEIINNLEKEINNTLYKMDNWSKKNKEKCESSFKNFKSSLLNTISSLNLENTHDIENKKQLLQIFMETDDDFKSRLRDNVFTIKFYLDCLSTVYQNIRKSKEDLNEKEEGDKKDINVIEITEENSSLFIKEESDDEMSFFPLRYIFSLNEKRKYFTLDIPLYTKKGFVVFKDRRDALTAMQSKIGSKVFSLEAEQAPLPNDIIWQNITKSEAISFFNKFFIDIIFILFNILFAYFAVSTIQFLKPDKLDQNGAFMTFLNEHEQIKSLYEGVLTPLIYNLLLFFVPTVIMTLVNMQGVYSYSEFQKVLMGKYSDFLFFNGFLSVFFGTTLAANIKQLVMKEKTFEEFIDTHGRSVIDSSLFFFNTIVQRTFVGVTMILLKPGPLIVNYLLSPFLPRKTRREQAQSEFSPPFDFGLTFPSILVVFSMTLVYSVICPPILIPGFLFFIYVYYILKVEFLYASRNEYESGGNYWNACIKIILNSLLVFQVVTAAKLFSDKKVHYVIGLIPLFWITFTFNSKIKKLFYRSCHYRPINVIEGEYLDTFTRRLKSERVEIMDKWEEPIDPDDDDTIKLEDFGFKDDYETHKKTHFKDPSTLSSFSSLILPKNFFNTVTYLQEEDSENLFSYKKTQNTSKE